ncbi:MAG: hypothetical protein OHK0022_39280 [Roseiflexaceae bacterium]
MDNNQLPPQMIPPAMIPPEQKREEQWTAVDSAQLADLVITFPDAFDNEPSEPVAVPTDGVVNSADGAELAAAAADASDAAAPVAEGIEAAAAASDGAEAAAEAGGVLDAIGDLTKMVSEIELPDIGEAISGLIEGAGNLLS